MIQNNLYKESKLGGISATYKNCYAIEPKLSALSSIMCGPERTSYLSNPSSVTTPNALSGFATSHKTLFDVSRESSILRRVGNTEAAMFNGARGYKTISEFPSGNRMNTLVCSSPLMASNAVGKLPACNARSLSGLAPQLGIISNHGLASLRIGHDYTRRSESTLFDKARNCTHKTGLESLTSTIDQSRLLGAKNYGPIVDRFNTRSAVGIGSVHDFTNAAKVTAFNPISPNANARSLVGLNRNLRSQSSGLTVFEKTRGYNSPSALASVGSLLNRSNITNQIGFNGTHVNPEGWTSLNPRLESLNVLAHAAGQPLMNKANEYASAALKIFDAKISHISRNSLLGFNKASSLTGVALASAVVDPFSYRISNSFDRMRHYEHFNKVSGGLNSRLDVMGGGKLTSPSRMDGFGLSSIASIGSGEIQNIARMIEPTVLDYNISPVAEDLPLSRENESTDDLLITIDEKLVVSVLSSEPSRASQLAEATLLWVLSAEWSEAFLGDLIEDYNERQAKDGFMQATHWCLMQILMSVWPLLFKAVTDRLFNHRNIRG